MTGKKLSIVMALAGLLAAPGLLVQAKDAKKVSSRLAYTVEIDPASRQVAITGTVAGHPREQVTRFTSFGLRKQVKIGVKAEDGLIAFRYQVPIGQAAFKDPFKPVLDKGFFAGFMSMILLAPRIEGVDFKNIPLTLKTPEGWKIATSRGVGSARYTLASLKDLTGTLVCAGDYSTYSFDLQHTNSKVRTKCHVAIRGERDWDDKEFLDEFKRLVRGQMDYFGGSHPAPVQFLALHLLPKGAQPRIPAFNRRAPGHDTVLALHTPDRSRRHFEFLGMLAHEHLHNWYPNAMKSDLGPWFMEGLNDYVAYRGLLANGLHNREQFSGMLSKWHREYEMCVRTKNQRVMPYRRGMIAAWVFDIEIRRATGGRSGLTEVLLRLIREKPDGGIVQRAHFLAMLKKVSGLDMEALYRHLVEDDGAIDLAAHLEGTGFRIAAETRAIEIRPETDAEKKLFAAILEDEKAHFDPVIKKIEGWTVHVDPKLLEGEHAETGARSLKMLANHLQRIAILLQGDRLEEMRKLEIWIEHHHPELGNMQYHPDVKWLTDRGYDARLVKKFHIPRAARLFSRHQMIKHPAVVLHELAHAYHDQVLGFDEPRIKAAYEKAMEAEIYDQVLLYTGRKVRHYAATNHKEYFAEGAEAYFYRNDFYPFVRAELKEHDPVFHDLLEKIWGPMK